MDLEEIKKKYESAKVFDYDPGLFMGKAQSLLENILKLDFSINTGQEWLRDNGNMVDLIDELWSDDDDFRNNLHHARKIRNDFAHKDIITADGASFYKTMLNLYITYLEDEQYKISQISDKSAYSSILSTNKTVNEKTNFGTILLYGLCPILYYWIIYILIAIYRGWVHLGHGIYTNYWKLHHPILYFWESSAMWWIVFFGSVLIFICLSIGPIKSQIHRNKRNKHSL
ncbi:hypothetical protein [Lactococcus allomyrinae]|uniref:Uncharacterized protein n=1 Tax=Lactococcus allomyrinae TaxID=2419773 RepID=A0A387BFS8_9LACT|nr:hypothetical protein [Lactococcus allomyrinae]AYF99769.1 hypothetical protein D7I46_00910 [Lactococcus allomyrinae]